MKWLRWILPLLSFVFVLNAMAEEGGPLVGTWYGNGGDDEEEHRWLITRAADGHFQQRYLFLYHDTKQYEWVDERGRWQHGEDVYQEINEAGEQVVYRIVELSEKKVSYHFLDEDEEAGLITENKVFDGFDLGTPPAGYSSTRLEPEAQ